jgi:S-DNA-T family DNA segregation ATPase FtsK/SpoIIIE
MATRVKSAKTQSPGKLSPDKEEQVSVKELIRDERTRKIAGTLSLLMCLFLFLAFASYLVTWQEDFDQAHKGIGILFSTDSNTKNLLGNLGAYVAHQFFFNGFGVASFLFCTLFFVAGMNAVTGKKIFSFWRNVRYVLAGILFLSVTFSFVLKGYKFPWGGAVGDMSSAWLVRMLGRVGTSALLLVAGLAYIIWRFNPVFRTPSLKFPAKQAEAVVAEPEVETADEPKQVKVKPNKLKKESTPVFDIVPEAEPEFVVIEKTEVPSTHHSLQTEDVSIPSEPPQGLEKYQPVAESVPSATLPLEINVNDGEVVDDQTGVPQTNLTVPYEPTWDLKDYEYPTLNLLEAHGSEKIIQDPAELEANKNQIINTLANYDIQIQKISATVGPTVTLYEIVPAAGVRISRIKNLEDDIALSLAALGIRIIAPIPGKGTIGIEVPNVKKTVVSMKTLLASDKFQNNAYSLPIAIGKKIDNENFIVDLTTMPHLLMAGATGQGKSVGLNAILVSLLYKKHPSQLKLVLVDPKKVELSLYRTIEHHFLAKLPGEEEAIITDTKKVIHTLNALCIEMDNRYDLLKEAGARNIREYNEKFVKRRLNPQKGHQFLPFIVLVIDEFADLIMTAGKEVEMPIARLAQLARAVGIHLIIATQRPSVNIITGTIKANFPARIAFKVSSKIDSRTILDTGGAEQLIGKGDMLISYNGEITRLQCAFVDTPEVEGVCDFIGEQRGYPQAFLLPEYLDEKEMEGKDFDMASRDALFEDAARLIVQNQLGSTSLLQRRMKLGYNRAGRLMDQLEAAGVVGPNQGSKARDVLIKTESELDQHLMSLG